MFHKTSIQTSKTMKASNLTSVHPSRPIFNSFNLLDSSTSTPCAETTYPKKMHFFMLPNSVASRNTYKTCQMWSICSVLVQLQISTSSKYTTTNSPMKCLKTRFINRIKLLGALGKPKGMTNHKLNLVLKTFSTHSLISF